jgi:hypothetical protein
VCLCVCVSVVDRYSIYMKILFVLFVSVTLVGCAMLRPERDLGPPVVTPRFSTTTMPDQYVDRCLELCKDNPSIKLSVGTGERFTYRCLCVTPDQGKQTQ